MAPQKRLDLWTVVREEAHLTNCVNVLFLTWHQNVVVEEITLREQEKSERACLAVCSPPTEVHQQALRVLSTSRRCTDHLATFCCNQALFQVHSKPWCNAATRQTFALKLSLMLCLPPSPHATLQHSETSSHPSSRGCQTKADEAGWRTPGTSQDLTTALHHKSLPPKRLWTSQI